MFLFYFIYIKLQNKTKQDNRMASHSGYHIARNSHRHTDIATQS